MRKRRRRRRRRRRRERESAKKKRAGTMMASFHTKAWTHLAPRPVGPRPLLGLGLREARAIVGRAVGPAPLGFGLLG